MRVEVCYIRLKWPEYEPKKPGRYIVIASSINNSIREMDWHPATGWGSNACDQLTTVKEWFEPINHSLDIEIYKARQKEPRNEKVESILEMIRELNEPFRLRD